MRFVSLLLVSIALTVGPLWAQTPEGSPAAPEQPAAPETPTNEPSDAEREAMNRSRNTAAADTGKAATELNTARQTFSRLQLEAGQAETGLKKAVAAVTSATALVEAAQATLGAATEQAEAAKATAEADGATEAQQQQAQQAAEAVTAAQQALEQAQADLQAAETKRDEVQAAKDAKAEALEQAQEQVTAAEAALAKAQGKAQAARAAKEAMERVAKTPRGPKMSMDDLRLRLRPLTDEELVVEADAWLAVLKGIATGISYADIASRGTEGEERDLIQEALTKLRDDRTEVVDRLDLVLGELERKGGDTKTYERYKGAITGLDYDADDLSGTYIAVKGWLLSPQGGVRWAINITLFVLVLIAFRIIGSVVGKMMGRALASSKVKTSNLLKDFFINVTRKTISFLGLVMALSMLEISVAPFLAAMGGGALVIGLALQGTLSNFAAGVMILMYRPYDIGHFVEVAGVKGTVDAMSLVATTLKTPDNQMVVVPNGSIWGGIITNVTGTPQRRVDMVFGIGYGDDMAKAEEILQAVVKEHPKVLETPAPVIKVSELADSSVNFVCRPWCKTADYWDVYWDVTRQVKERFDAAGVSIPFPQTDIHVHQVTSSAS